MVKYLYMAVTCDEFEFPICVEESVNELATKLDVEPSCVYGYLSNRFSGKITNRKILKVKKI